MLKYKAIQKKEIFNQMLSPKKAWIKTVKNQNKIMKGSILI